MMNRFLACALMLRQTNDSRLCDGVADCRDFADELEQQRSRLIADHSTFDQALSRVMGAIAA